MIQKEGIMSLSDSALYNNCYVRMLSGCTLLMDQ